MKAIFSSSFINSLNKHSSIKKEIQKNKDIDKEDIGNIEKILSLVKEQ